MAFCVLVNVHKVAKNPDSMPAQKKNIELPKHFTAFLKTFVIALTIHTD